MSALGGFQSWLSNTKSGLKDGVKRFKNKELLDAIVAGCSIVAAADGSIDASEKQKMSGFLNRSEELKVFNMPDVIERFNHFAANLEWDALVGKQEALRAIAKFKGKLEIGRIIVGVCCAVGSADGDFDEKEKAIVRDICNVLELSPGEFSL